MVKFELQEKDLELVVNEKTLGSLTTNAKQIKMLVEKALPNYDIANYNESNIALAKKDKSMLNAAGKALNDKRIQFEKEFMQPFAEFKAVVNDTVSMIKVCSGKIDAVVKQSEENEKTAKRADIEAMWASKNFGLVPLTKIFDSRWLNKSTTLKTVEADIDQRVSKINDDITTIEAMEEDADLLKSLYLDTLNLNSTIQYARTLKQNRERAKAEAEARAKAAEIKAAEVKVEVPQPAPVIAAPIVEACADPEPELLIRAFKVTTTRENIIKLGEFMNENGIVFKKIEL